MSQKPKPRAKYAATRNNGEVPAPYFDKQDNTYRYGDGDIIQFKRVGSDHSHLKSKGTLC